MAEPTKHEQALLLKLEGMYQTVRGLKKELAVAGELHRWIPVGERLPEEGQKNLLVLVMSGTPYIAYQYRSGIWYDRGRRRMQIITHWKPIQSVRQAQEEADND